MMRRIACALIVAAVAVGSLTGCSDNPSPREAREIQQTKCFDAGGVYFEYEDTSAGVHIWCANEDGAEISGLVSEGDD